MFIIHLFTLVLGDLFVCSNFGKNGTKHEHRRQVEVAGGSGRPWWGRLALLRHCWLPLPPTTSLILPKYKKHTPKLRPPLISYRFKMKGREEASHGILTHHAYDGAQIDKISCIPTLYITRGATT
jgi:hypothetical protein